MVDKGINDIINAYNKLVKGIDSKAESSVDRAYGGIIRAGKGKLVEVIARQMVKIAWVYGLDEDLLRLEMNAKKIKVAINKKYVGDLKEKVKKHILDNIDHFYYNAGTDVHVYIDGTFVMAIECKAYTENAMLKRILVDASLLKKYANIKKYVLLQLESQLGGDYCELKDIDSTIGSPSTRTLLSHFDVNLDILTLLDGERRVNRPIHRKEFFKELTYDSVRKAVFFFIDELREFK